MVISHLRQQDILHPSEVQDEVNVIGAGGIGSYSAFVLAKMGFSAITVWDFDTVENHNIPNQIFGPEHLGKNKAEALQTEISRLSGIEINAKQEKYVGQPLSGIVVSAVDSMAQRQVIWDTVKYNIGVKLFVDGRMGGEEMAIYAIRPYLPSDIKFYEQFMHSDEVAHQEACTAQSIVYNTFTIAGFIGNIVKQFIKGENYPSETLFDMRSWKIVQHTLL